MLAGCYAISFEIHGQHDLLGQLIVLIAVFNCYELLVITLGLSLAKTKSFTRDAVQLLLLELLLLLDITFLYNECFTISPKVGFAINTMGALLAFFKLTVICRELDIQLRFGFRVLLSIDLLLVYWLPGIFRLYSLDGELAPELVYSIWWSVGALLALHGLPESVIFSPGRHSSQRLQPIIVQATVALPIVAVIAHVAAGHYVYDTAFYPAAISPILLGLAVVCGHGMFIPRPGNIKAASSLSLCLLAVILSNGYPDSLITTTTWPVSCCVTPLRLTIASAGLVCILNWLIRKQQWMILPAMVFLALILMGHSPHTILQQVSTILETTAKWWRIIRPGSIYGWGIAAVTLSFLLLGTGAVACAAKKMLNAGSIRRQVSQMET